MLSVPLSTSDLHYSCQVMSTGSFKLFCHAFWFSLKGCSPFFSYSFVVLPTRCLLDVSCLLRLTLRPSAPVCSCHRDSLTRGRLAILQEAVRVFCSVFSIGSARGGMFPVISDSLRVMSRQALLKYEGPAGT